MKIYTVEEMANELGVYKQNIYKDIKEGKLYPVLHVGKRIVVTELAYMAYIYNFNKEDIDKLILSDIKKVLA